MQSFTLLMSVYLTRDGGVGQTLVQVSALSEEEATQRSTP